MIQLRNQLKHPQSADSNSNGNRGMLLTGPQQKFAIRQDSIVRYHRDMAPFIAVDPSEEISNEGILKVIEDDEEVVLVDKGRDLVLESLQVVKTSIADQMVYDREQLIEIDSEIMPIDETFANDMVKLTSEVFPGYFRKNTVMMGRYGGIFRTDRLVAMAGERMRPCSSFQELSGICTLPQYRGMGYAGRVTSWVARQALSENRQPFLHVNSENHAAIRVYERLGFKKRTSFVIRRLRRVTQ